MQTAANVKVVVNPGMLAAQSSRAVSLVLSMFLELKSHRQKCGVVFQLCLLALQIIRSPSHYLEGVCALGRTAGVR
jgi:hypothetical protein